MAELLEIRPRFRRSVRIDMDFRSRAAIDGFVCPSSFRNALSFMADHIKDTGQGAFTWTGPYGSGKSSLALALGCLTGAKKDIRDKAASLFGDNVLDALKSALPYYPSRWDVLPIVIEKRSITEQLSEALSIPADADNPAGRVLKALREKSTGRGLLLILDELGRGLEAAADGDGDVHLLQDLAELSARSDGKLIFVGILHQSFEEYADKLGREARDKWAKIQGRFVDISVNISLDETVELIAQAMDQAPSDLLFQELITKTVSELRPKRQDQDTRALISSLSRCGSMHPVVTCLLGPLSRRRFGQNQRSVFSFLHSSEPFGLQDPQAISAKKAIYPPFRLWDYVQANFESSVLASPDSKRWSIAAEAVDRCIGRGGSGLEVNLLKTIGIIDLVKDRSVMPSSREILRLSFQDHEIGEVDAALTSLERNSEIVFRKHINSYVLFAGSDFDIDAHVGEILQTASGDDLSKIRSLADLQPILCKRHHRETGAMRWFELNFMAVSQLRELAQPLTNVDTIGRVIQVIPTENESRVEVDELVKKFLTEQKSVPSILGYSELSRRLLDFGRELTALEQLEELHPALRGDLVARREIEARSAELKRRIEGEVEFLFENSDWHINADNSRKLTKRALNDLLSNIADALYFDCPAIQNELLNCSKPSPNAVSARTKLLKRITQNVTEANLGFEGKNYPAERGLYVSLIEGTSLHVDTGGIWEIRAPDASSNPMTALWQSADCLIAASPAQRVTAQDIIDKWSQPPIGLKAGLSYVYVVLYALSRRDKIAIYGEGVFHSFFNELCVEYLSRNPQDIVFRKVEMEGEASAILRELGVMLGMSGELEPLSVARNIVSEYYKLVPWTGRTQSLSPMALKVREILKRANDPNKLLFDDLPSLSEPNEVGELNGNHIASLVHSALTEMQAAYPKTLRELKLLMLEELDVRTVTDGSFDDLRSRADNIRQIGGDLRMDAFVARIAKFAGTDDDMEGIASIAANKLPRDWNDSDREKARVGIVELAGTFLKTEAIARVKGRKDRRRAVALVVGKENSVTPIYSEFEISEADNADVLDLADAIENTLVSASAARREVILAALTEVVGKYIKDHPGGQA